MKLSDKPAAQTTQAAEAPQPSRAVRWVGLVVVPLVLVALLVALAEGAVRVRQWSRYGTFGSLGALYRFDDTIGGRVLVPGANVGPIQVNSLGFRGPEVTNPKPAGTVRVAFLGASTTFCAEVSSNAAVWTQQVTDELRRRFPGTQFDFVNGGVPGYAVATTRRNWKHRVAALKPDIVVVYHATNDFSGEVNRLATRAGLRVADNRTSWLEQHLLLWELVAKNLRVMAAQHDTAAKPQRKLQVDPTQLGANFRAELGELLRETRESGARVAVATFATQLRRGQSAEQQQRAAVSALIYMPMMTIPGLMDGYARYNQLIAEAAAAEGALLIGGEEAIPGDPAHFFDSVHFTDLGARAMAARVSEALATDAGVRALIERHRR